MGNISVSLPSDGQTIDAADYNTPINTIVGAINGGLDDSNIASGAAIAGSKLADAAVTSTKINFGGSGAGVWWEEIARTSLSVAGDTITVNSIPARAFLCVKIFIIATGGTARPQLRFNNISTATYAWSHLYNSAGTALFDNQVSQTAMNLDGGNIVSGGSGIYTLEVSNPSTNSKQLTGQSNNDSTVAATTSPVALMLTGKWVSNDQVTRIDIINGGGGDFAIGSKVIVLGHD